MLKMIFSKLINILILLIFIFKINLSLSQFVNEGRIIYERKTNLEKKFKDERAKRWINDQNKIAIDEFELYFNDTISVYLPIDDPSKKGMMSWATIKNSHIHNLKNYSRTSIYNIWGEFAYIQDSSVVRKWKITESKRKIGKYQCTKAIFELNDSTRLYAWYSEEILPSIGPETFNGLPGAILGLATEDGGVVYFAKKVDDLKADYQKIMPKIGKKKYSSKEFNNKLISDFGDKPWAKDMVKEILMW